MSHGVRYLALLSCLLLPLPQGWCCSLGTLACCARPASHDRPAKPAKPSCCCCADEPVEATAPAAPSPPPRPHCCCGEKAPVVLPDTGRIVPDLAATFLPFAAESAPVAQAEAGEARQASPIPLHPPRNILHCVWLC